MNRIVNEMFKPWFLCCGVEKGSRKRERERERKSFTSTEKLILKKKDPN